MTIVGAVLAAVAAAFGATAGYIVVRDETGPALFVTLALVFMAFVLILILAAMVYISAQPAEYEESLEESQS